MVGVVQRELDNDWTDMFKSWPIRFLHHRSEQCLRRFIRSNRGWMRPEAAVSLLALCFTVTYWDSDLLPNTVKLSLCDGVLHSEMLGG